MDFESYEKLLEKLIKDNNLKGFITFSSNKKGIIHTDSKDNNNQNYLKNLEKLFNVVSKLDFIISASLHTSYLDNPLTTIKTIQMKVISPKELLEIKLNLLLGHLQ